MQYSTIPVMESGKVMKNSKVTFEFQITVRTPSCGKLAGAPRKLSRTKNNTTEKKQKG